MNPMHEIKRAIFDKAIQIESSEERALYLDEACESNPQIRSDVNKLIADHFRAGAFLENAIAPALGESVDNLVSTQIGPYVLREQIGEGGMGVVYVAEQTEPVQRKVALKVIKPGMDTKEVIARFEAERQALAFMEHPNIARVLDAGETESGRSYFVMELVRGIPITEYCDQVKLSPRERLELFTTVCDAVQHAHQKGIIHRDIKPSNVLVTQISAKPVIKVIDFGLAKATSGQRLTDKTLYTGFMRLMGTPVYMSPEQAGLSGLDIDTRSDIYSLGVLLYEVLTGTTPLDKIEIQQKAYEELCRQICEVEAPKPSARISTLKDAERSTIAQLRQIEPRSLRQLLNGDLDRVVLKALEKDRDRRYETPKELAADLERFLEDKPVLAVPPSPLYLARKFMRRHKVAILTAASILALLVVATGVSTWQAILLKEANSIANASEEEALAARDDADDARQQAELTAEARRLSLYASNMQLAYQKWDDQAGQSRQIQQLLAAWIPTDSKEDLREFSWRYLWTRLHQGALHSVSDTSAVAVSPNNNLLTADTDGIREWSETGELVGVRWPGDASSSQFSHDGRLAAIRVGGDTKLVDIATRATVHEFPNRSCTFSANGQFIILTRTDVRPSDIQPTDIQIWNPATGVAVPFESLLPADLTQFLFTPWHSDRASLSPNGKSLLFRKTWSSVVTVTAVLEDRAAPYVWFHNAPVRVGVWSPTGRIIATGLELGDVRLRLVTDPDHYLVVRTHGRRIHSIAFTPDAQRLIAGGTYGTVDIWDISALDVLSRKSADEISELKSLREPGSDGESASHPTIELGQRPRLVRSFKAHLDPVKSIVVSSNGSRLATRDENGVARLWNLKEDVGGQKVEELGEDLFAGNLGIVLENADAGGVRVTQINAHGHDVLRGEIRVGDRIVGVTEGVSDAGELDVATVSDAAVRPTANVFDVDRWLRGPFGSTVRLTVASAPTNEHSMVELRRTVYRHGQCTGVAFSPDGEQLAVACIFHGATRIGLNGQEPRRFAARGTSAAFSPNGRWLAMDDTNELLIWDLSKDEQYARLDANVNESRMDADLANLGYGTLAFSPDSKYLAMGTGYRFGGKPRSDLKVWNVDTLEEIGKPLFESLSGINGVVFTPSGDTLIAADADGKTQFWNTSTWDREKRVLNGGKTRSLAITSDGKLLAQAGGWGARIWDLESNEQHGDFLRGNVTACVAFSPKIRGSYSMVTGGYDGNVVVWDVRSNAPLGTLRGHRGAAMDVDFSADGNSLAIVDSAGHLRILRAAPFSEIDRHPLTTQSMYQIGVEQNQDRRYAAAEATLHKTLRLQEQTLPQGHLDLENTRKELVRSFTGQGAYPIISKQPMTTRVEQGDAVTLTVEVDNEDARNFAYQWFFAGHPIDTANKATYSIPGISASQFGRYHVEIASGHRQLEALPARSDDAFLIGSDGIAKGGLRKDVFLNISGSSVAKLIELERFPDQPDEVGSINAFELPSDVADHYGARVSGFLIPPKTGNYVFYLVSDDDSQLFLSTDPLPANKVMIASLTGWKIARSWETLDPENVSEPIPLQAGKRYWVEAFFKEDYRGDSLAVTWQMPGEPPPKNGDPPISGDFLEHRLE